MLKINGRTYNVRFTCLREAVEHIIESHIADEDMLRDMEVVVSVNRCVMIKKQGDVQFSLA